MLDEDIIRAKAKNTRVGTYRCAVEGCSKYTWYGDCCEEHSNLNEMIKKHGGINETNEKCILKG